MTVQTAVFNAVGNFAPLRREAYLTSSALMRVDAAATTAFGKGFVRGTARAAKGMVNVGSTMTKSITLPVAVLGGLAIHTFAEFQSQITQAGLKAGATKDQMAAMKDEAIELGKATIFSASDAARGMNELAAAGFNAENTIAAMPGVTRAAQAANADLGETAKIVATAMNAFNLKGAESAHVADVLTQSANTSAIDIHGLGYALAQAGQLGATANQSLEDVVAAISRLANLGVPAHSAGAAIRQGMVSLQAPTQAAATVIDSLGIKVRDAKGELLPLPDIVKNLGDALNKGTPAMKFWDQTIGMSTEQLAAWAKQNGISTTVAKNGQRAVEQGGTAFKDYAMRTIFGVEGGKAFGLMIGKTKPLIISYAKEADKMRAMQDGLSQSMGEKGARAWIRARTEAGKFRAEGPDIVRAMAAMEKGSDGISKKFGLAFSKTTAARIEQFQGSMETLAIQLVTLVLPALNGFVTRMTNVVNAVITFSQQHPGITKVALAILGVLAVAGPLLWIFGKLIFGVLKFVGILLELGDAFAALAGILGLSVGWLALIVIAVIALVAGFVLLWKRSERFRSFWIGLWSVIQSVVKTAWERWIKPALEAIGDFVMGTVIPALQALWKAAVPVFQGIAAVVVWAWRTMILPALKFLWWYITKVVIPVGKMLLQAYVTTFRLIARIVVWAWKNMIWPALKALWWYISKVIWPVIKNLYTKLFRPIFQFIGALIHLWWDVMVKPVLKAFWAYLTKVIFPVLRWLWKKVFVPIFHAIGSVIETVWKTSIKPTFDALKWAVGKLQKPFEVAVSGIKKAWEGLKAAVKAPIVLAIRIINAGLIRPFNWLAGKLGSDAHVDEISTKFSAGGPVKGKNTSRRKDDVPALLTSKEHVIRQESAVRLRRREPGLLEYLNTHGALPSSRRPRRHTTGPRKYAGGGMVYPVGMAPSMAYWDPDDAARVVAAGGSGAWDFPVPTGTRVRAPWGGTVTASRDYGNTSYGRMLAMWHASQGVGTVYAHLLRPLVTVGQRVSQGAGIAISDNTGGTTGAHLHFEITGGKISGLGGAAGGSPVEQRASGLADNLVAIIKNPWSWLKAKIEGPLKAIKDSTFGKMVKAAPRAIGHMFSSNIVKMGAQFLKKGVKGMAAWGWNHSPAGAAVSLIKKLFDGGGVARGAGVMPKRTLQPERVLSPRQTDAFDALVSNLLGPAPTYATVMSKGSPGAYQEKGAGNTVHQTFHWEVYNPVPEKTSETSLRTLTRVAQVGMGG